MGNNRGQASILIAILFQVLFIFFAMVVNVGLLVHDKINLQNSADVAAYYGALKQAQVLNTMAHINYQIRQAWKLFNFRLWVLADSGKNIDFTSGLAPQPTEQTPFEDFTNETPPCSASAKANTSLIWPGCYEGPVICLANRHWQEYIKESAAHKEQNICYDPNMTYKGLTAIKLTPFQMIAPGINGYFFTLQQQSQQNSSSFFGTFKNVGNDNYTMALRFLASYKMAVAHRRVAMHKLQAMLIKGSQDFTDLSGQSVSNGAETTFKNNLTGANQQGLNFEFTNGLTLPFIVPIEVRAFVKYQDNVGQGKDIKAVIQDITELPAEANQGVQELAAAGKMFTDTDYVQATAPSAQGFAEEPEDTSNRNMFRSLVGFEKNPWVMAYVHVHATSQPSMLFSPFSKNGKVAVTLTADSYAMPFGGRMGPWYYNTWDPNSEFSQGNSLIDPLLPARMDGSGDANGTIPPNYSRFPGDKAGMRSRLARFLGVSKEERESRIPALANYQHVADNLNADPVVLPVNGDTKLRDMEVAALAPDLFDSSYYSVDPNWVAHLGDAAQNLFGSICEGQCFNLGTTGSDPSFIIDNQVAQRNAIFPEALWELTSPDKLNTGWSQGDPGQYDKDYAQGTVGQKEISGGRSGYSVKLVSKRYLQNSSFALGGSGQSGPIRNHP